MENNYLNDSKIIDFDYLNGFTSYSKNNKIAGETSVGEFVDKLFDINCDLFTIKQTKPSQFEEKFLKDWCAVLAVSFYKTIKMICKMMSEYDQSKLVFNNSVDYSMVDEISMKTLYENLIRQNIFKLFLTHDGFTSKELEDLKETDIQDFNKTLINMWELLYYDSLLFTYSNYIDCHPNLSKVFDWPKLVYVNKNNNITTNHSPYTNLVSLKYTLYCVLLQELENLDYEKINIKRKRF